MRCGPGSRGGRPSLSRAGTCRVSTCRCRRVVRRRRRQVRDADAGVSPRHVFGAMLRFYRMRSGLSQEQFGARIHYSPDQVGKVENAQRSPTEDFTAACDAVPELRTDGALTELRERLKDYFQQRAYPGWFAHWPDAEA